MVFLHGTNLHIFVSLSTTTKMELFPVSRSSGNATIQSMEMVSHGCCRGGIGCNNPAWAWFDALFFWQK